MTLSAAAVIADQRPLRDAAESAADGVDPMSMARGTADTATSDFFILLDEQPSLDFGGKRFDDAQGAAAFGRVLSGLDVVRRIQQQPVQGQNLTPAVSIIRITRVIV